MGALSFQEAANVHIEVTNFFTTAIKAVESAAKTFLSDLSTTSMYSDGQPGAMQVDRYAPQGWWTGSNAASQAFLTMDPYTTMVTELLDSAYRRLLALADTASERVFEIPAARAGVRESLYEMYQDLKGVYADWGVKLSKPSRPFR
jgi:hypothetical protein